MYLINGNSIVDLVFNLKWKSHEAVHLECYNGTEMNIWRDWIPEKLKENLLGQCTGDEINISFKPGEFLPNFSEKNQFTIKNKQFNRTLNDDTINPRQGRFYPKGLLKDVAGVFKANQEPFRCVDVNNSHIDVDLNHPLSSYNLNLNAAIGNVRQKYSDKGGQSTDWVWLMTTGTGIQARWRKAPTDFFSDMPFIREDENCDNLFYNKPRLIHHFDDTAREMVRNIHGMSMKDGMDILDLMSSWVTHLPDNVKPGKVSGLGMNEKELKINPDLNDYVVHDLNKDPKLPFASESFDVIICTASIEYLIHPFEIFKEASRVLRDKGKFIITFSNRWFPPKAIQIWKSLHEFERIGLVMEYFLKTKDFEHIHTYSVRGLPRPASDKYFSQLLYSDPIYGVWAAKI